MREQMIQQQREHLQTVQSLTTAFHAQISELIRGLPIPPAIASESDAPSIEGSHLLLDILIIKLLHKGTINLNCGVIWYMKLLTISYQKICVAFFITVQEILNNIGNFGNLQI